MYFQPEMVRQFFDSLVKHFSNAEVHFDAIAAAMRGKGKQHDTAKHTRADFNWDVTNPTELEQWNKRL